jgi:methylmalonyl-CoA/ethylmalonyl-CoA epimerase
MEDPTSVDHITICVESLDDALFLFTKVLGFDLLWSAKDVGSEKSSMDTVVVRRGKVKIALMEGHDKAVKSQINEFIERFGQGVQHVALEVDDIEAVSREWESHGVRFCGPVKQGRDGFGPLRQRFTYPLFPTSGLFIELTQRKEGGEKSTTFVRETVESLYRDIERDQNSEVKYTIIDYESFPRTNQKQKRGIG